MVLVFYDYLEIDDQKKSLLDYIYYDSSRIFTYSHLACHSCSQRG